jgi:hypothetical protein
MKNASIAFRYDFAQEAIERAKKALGLYDSYNAWYIECVVDIHMHGILTPPNSWTINSRMESCGFGGAAWSLDNAMELALRLKMRPLTMRKPENNPDSMGSAELSIGEWNVVVKDLTHHVGNWFSGCLWGPLDQY